MFKADSSIRYMAIVDDQYRILASKYNEEVIPLTSDETDRNFVSIVPRIIVESVEKLSPFLGEVGGITAHFKKALVIFYPLENLIVAISFQPDQKTPFYDGITETFRKTSARYLT